MKRVLITNRNKNLVCRRCGRKLGETEGKYAYVTHRNNGKRHRYCEQCWKIIQDSTEAV